MGNEQAEGWLVSSVESSLSQETEGVRGSFAPRLPDFIIFGATKSGTTWLHHALRQHRQIFMPAGETPFFSDPYYGDGDLSRLANVCKGANGKALVGIKSPDYLGQAECAPRIEKHLPSVKLIAFLRDPVDRAISHYFHLVRSGRLEVTSPDDFFMALLAGDTTPLLERNILGHGRYAANFQNYRKALDEGRVLVMAGSGRQEDVAAVYTRACDFLGVSAANPPKDLALPRNLGSYSKRYVAALGALHRVHLAYDRETGAGTIRGGIASRVAAPVLRLVSKASSVTRLLTRDRPLRLSEDVRARLYTYYKPDIERLQQMTGLDLSNWTHPGRA